VDLVTMTGNVAQVFLTDELWAAVLAAARDALRPGGRLVFETRDPARQARRDWGSESSAVVPGIGGLQTRITPFVRRAIESHLLAVIAAS
jgi:hypothetical protein